MKKTMPTIPEKPVVGYSLTVYQVGWTADIEPVEMEFSCADNTEMYGWFPIREDSELGMYENKPYPFLSWKSIRNPPWEVFFDYNEAVQAARVYAERIYAEIQKKLKREFRLIDPNTPSTDSIFTEGIWSSIIELFENEVERVCSVLTKEGFVT